METQDKETLERDKEAFIVQYWNQNILRHDLRYIELRSVRQLTDKEYSLVAKISGVAFFEQDSIKVGHFVMSEFMSGYAHPKTEPFEFLKVFDYLRSIGILIPFRGYSVEEILRLGWAKIKEA